MRLRFLPLFALLTSMGSLAAPAASFFLDKSSDLVVPSSRGSANTTWFGWDLFTDVNGLRVDPVDDSTPDIGTTAAGVNFKTNGTSVHIAPTSGNFYASDAVAETVTVATSGTVGTGFTTIIVQAITGNGNLPGAVTFSAIGGVNPTVVQGLDKAGKGQLWVKWQVPGNSASYTFTIGGPANTSFDKFVVDTQWIATDYQPDTAVAVTPTLVTALDKTAVLLEPSTRSTINTTWFGWDLFSDVDGLRTGQLDDSSPDIGTTTTGVNIKTTGTGVHISSTGNFYSAGGPVAETVTVATDGTPGTGFTTVIAQAITAFGNLPGTITFGAINGVFPVVVQGLDTAGKGQIWAKWQIPGNAASYTFTLAGPADTSIDKFVVDTKWSATGYQTDSVLTTIPALASAIDKTSVLLEPSTRSTVNSTWFGWDLFTDANNLRTGQLDDSTPDIGTTTTGVNIKTTGSGVHISSTGNFYSAGGPVAETVTVATSGTPGTGFTTIIAQAITAFGNLPGAITFGNIGGVAPTVVQGVNLAAKGQVWAKWQVPGNAASYTFTIAGPSDSSFDKFVVDTKWSATGYQTDSVLTTVPALATSLDKASAVLAPSTRSTVNSTWFGWDVFADANNQRTGQLDDSTPDIGTTTTGVNIKTTGSGVHISSTGNFYSAGGPVAETVTVATSGTVGTGFTTIIAQAITAFGGLPGPLTFGDIAGVSPTVVQAVGNTGKGQVWAKWQIPGNSASYTFTLAGLSDSSFDKFVVDTKWSATGFQTDSVLAAAPALTSVLDKVTGFVVPSSRDTASTTYFGWESFFDAAGTISGVVDDSTPDIGNTAIVGANFKTNSTAHHSIGNLYTNSTPLDEQITIPTTGTVGSTGFTTIILQILSAPGFGAFSDTINLGSIEGVAPTIAQSVNSANIGQLWAKWEVPGNKASYVVTLTSPSFHFSFDRLIVDTKYSATAYVADTTVTSLLAITTASPLPAGKTDAVYSPVTFTAIEGTASVEFPYTWALGAGSGPLPTGLTLSTAGVLSGTPTVAGTFFFTVEVTDHLENTATRAFALTTAAAPVISTASPLANMLVGVNSSVTLTGTGGTGTLSWTKSAGTLPDGVTLSSAGVLSGIPTVGGVFTFTAQITDDNSFTATKEFQLTVIALRISTASPLIGAVKGLAYSATFTATGAAGTPSWTLDSGTLPAGLQLSSAGVLSGKPTVAISNAAFTVKVTDANSVVATKAFTLTVTAGYLKPVLEQPALGTTTVGVQYSFVPVASNYPSSFTVTGLPAGIKYVAATKSITGRATVAGVFNVKITAVNAAGASLALNSQLTVKSLPNTLIGSFAGLVVRDNTANGKLGSTLTLTTTATGSYTAKVTTGATIKSYIGGFLSPTAPQVDTVATAALPKLTLTLDAATNLISGTYNGAAISGWKQTWNAATNPPVNLQGYYSVGIDLADAGDDGMLAIPQGSGYATFTVAAAGTLTVSGKTADGQVITTAGFVGPNGQILVHTPLYANLGSVTGTLALTEDADGAFANNVASGALTWVKPVTTGHTYETGFGLTTPVNLKAYGKYLASAPTGQEVLGLPDTGLANVIFEDGGLGVAQSVIDPDLMGFTYTDANKILLPSVNPGKVVLTIASTSGLVGGSFTLVDSGPALTRKVVIQGQVVRTASGGTKATGYFLLPQKPAAGKTIATSSILSGKLTITQPQ